MFIREQLESIIFILTNLHEDVANMNTKKDEDAINTHVLQQIELIIDKMTQFQDICEGVGTKHKE